MSDQSTAATRSALYIDHHNDVFTSAGTASAIDACLHFVRSRLGSPAASTVARHIVVAPHRDGDEAQFVEYPIRPQHGFKPIGDTRSHCFDWRDDGYAGSPTRHLAARRKVVHVRD